MYKQMSTKQLRRIFTQVSYHLVLAMVGLAFFLPLAWMISTSLKPDVEIFVFPPKWLPSQIIWSNYPKALSTIPFFLYLKNTLFLCLMNVIGTVASCSLVAYSFARIKWIGRNFLFIVVLGTMMLPFPVTMIPLFLVFKQIGWLNSFYPLIAPAFFGSPFYIFLLRQFFLTIPYDLSDAARIDGCSEFMIFLRIILPLSRPALATVALFTFLATWNDFLAPLIYLNDPRMWTLALGLQRFQSQHSTDWQQLMAAATVMTLPIVVLFFLTQRTFIKGIATTGIKG